MVARIRSAASIFYETKGMLADFVPQSHCNEISRGFQLNHSIWSRDGKNLFLDVRSPDRLSQLGRHWIAGLLTHARALTVLGWPTVSCYRIFAYHLAPKVVNWGLDDRRVLFRVRVEEDNVFIECRIGSSASNPYLFLAGVLAAGIDGIQRQLSLDDIALNEKVPRDLESALQALEADQYMVKCLGEDFVRLYAYNKRTYEIEPLTDLCLNVKDEQEQINVEAEFYQDLN